MSRFGNNKLKLNVEGIIGGVSFGGNLGLKWGIKGSFGHGAGISLEYSEVKKNETERVS